MISNDYITEVFRNVARSQPFTKNDFEEYAKLLDKDQGECDSIYQNMNTLKKPGKILKVFYIVSTIIAFSLFLFFLFHIFKENHLGPTYFWPLVIFIISTSCFVYCQSSIGKYNTTYDKFRQQLTDANNKLELDFITLKLIGLNLDAEMYKEIYDHMYNVQEWLSKNDVSGYKSFVNAFQVLNIDLSKYTSLENASLYTTKDIDIEHYFN